jgi:hypothetical protein
MKVNACLSIDENYVHISSWCDEKRIYYTYTYPLYIDIQNSVLPLRLEYLKNILIVDYLHLEPKVQNSIFVFPIWLVCNKSFFYRFK